MEGQYKIITHYVVYFGMILCFWVAIFLALRLINRLFPGSTNLAFFNNNIIVITGFSFVGFTVGVLSGLSKTPVIDVVIPSLLTFISGFFAYIFVTKEFDVENKKFASSILIIFPVFLIHGLEIGSEHRFETEEYLREYDLWKEERLIDKNQKNLIELETFKCENLKSTDLPKK